MLLENSLGMARRVHRGYDMERKSAKKGDTIQIHQPSSLSVTTGGSSTVQDLSTNSIDITVDQWKQVRFGLTDKELAYTGDQIVQTHIQPAIYALANNIETALTGLYAYVPWSYDIASTVTAADIIGTRKILRDQAGPLVDTDMVHFGIDSTLEASFLGLGIFHQAYVTGGAENQSALMHGHLGTRFGVEHFVQQTLTSHTSGTVVSATNDVAGVLAATGTIRATTISVSGLTGTETLAAGDSFVIAGNSQRYVVTAAATLTGGANASISIYPALKQQYASGVAVTFETISSTNYADKYYANIMFHRNAFAFATAPLSELGNGAGANMKTVTDPRTGLSIRARLAYDDDSAKVVVTLDILYGVKCIEPNLAVIARRNY